MHVQPRATAIADALSQFAARWPGGSVAANLSGAYQDLAATLAAFGIQYGQNAASKTANPGVNPLHIGELIDMLRTLYNWASNPDAFIPEKFTDKLTGMVGMLLSYTDSFDDSDNEALRLATRNAELNKFTPYDRSDDNASTQAQYGSDGSYGSMSYGSDQAEGGYGYGSDDRDHVGQRSDHSYGYGYGSGASTQAQYGSDGAATAASPTAAIRPKAATAPTTATMWDTGPTTATAPTPTVAPERGMTLTAPMAPTAATTSTPANRTRTGPHTAATSTTYAGPAGRTAAAGPTPKSWYSATSRRQRRRARPPVRRCPILRPARSGHPAGSE